MRRNRLFLGAALAVLGVSLASCGAKEVRNTVTPYGSLNGLLKENVATAGENEAYKMSLEQFYDKLRFNGYGKVNNAIERSLYAEEFNAISNLYNGKLTADDKTVLTILDKDGKEIGNIDERIADLKEDLDEQVNSVIATKIFSTAKPEEIATKKKNTKEFNKAVYSFIDAQAKLGVKLTYEQLTTYTVDENKDYVIFSADTLNALSDAVNAVILEEAKLISSMKKIGELAEKPSIKEKDEDGKETDKEIKNPNQIQDSEYENLYDTTYKTYGTYNAIVIQFNSKRDAEELISKVGFNAADPLTSYINLYKEHYNYRIKEDATLDKSFDDFIYHVNEDDNDFSDLPQAVASFVKDTLKDNEYLTEPRNINNKYVLVYKLDTKYEYHTADENEQLPYKDFEKIIKGEAVQSNLGKDEASNLKTDMRLSIIETKAKNYQATDFKEMLQSDDLNLRIYDPFFEYKFEYANPEFYDHITEEVSADSNLIFSIGKKDGDKYPIEYTVDDFFKEASREYATPIITEHFQLEYTKQFYNEYVEKHLISKTAKEDNKKALDEAIKGFKANKNSTYPAEIGQDTFLLASYGYKNPADVENYYFDAKASLNAYISVKVFDEWATGEGDDAKISDKVFNDKSILSNILKTGNSLLADNKLFNINLDHFLINIDENGDGTPDDPQEFLAKLDENGQKAFEDAVTELAQAIIHEASSEKYSQNTLFETLKYIKGEYEEGAELLNPINPAKTTWDDYKDYNFLITVEQLASSGDITQDSVNNFVPEFKEYVENVYKEATNNKLELDEDDEKGKFYVVNTKAGEALNGHVVNTENANTLTTDELCATSFGYHILVVNSYEGPESTKYTENDDISGFQKNIQVVLRKYDADKDDKDDKSEFIYAYTDSYNKDSDKAATMNQLFIYYVQQANGVDSSLDSDIKKIMGSLFDGAISTYTSSNFQTWLILDKLNITISTKEFAGVTINADAVNAEMNSIKNSINTYDEANSIYKEWFTTYTWERPAI